MTRASRAAARNLHWTFRSRDPNSALDHQVALYLMKFLGLFRLARHLTRHGLRIVCYHGFAVGEEYKYRSTLFIREDFFRKRMEYLKRERYPILALRDALDALAAGRLPPCATVITMDDGWRGVYTVGLPIIQELGIPVTVYVTTYYVENRMPVYTVTVSYLFWKPTPEAGPFAARDRNF